MKVNAKIASFALVITVAVSSSGCALLMSLLGMGLDDPSMSLEGGQKAAGGYIVTGVADQQVDGGKIYGLYNP